MGNEPLTDGLGFVNLNVSQSLMSVIVANHGALRASFSHFKSYSSLSKG